MPQPEKDKIAGYIGLGHGLDSTECNSMSIYTDVAPFHAFDAWHVNWRANYTTSILACRAVPVVCGVALRLGPPPLVHCAPGHS